MSNIVDSSAWLEYFAGTKNGHNFSTAIEDLENLIVPSVVLFEVFKKILIEKDETEAINKTAHMRLGKVIEIDSDIAILSAKIGHEMGLRAMDSIIYAIAWLNNSTLWTQDADFKNFDGVKYFQKS